MIRTALIAFVFDVCLDRLGSIVKKNFSVAEPQFRFKVGEYYQCIESQNDRRICDLFITEVDYVNDFMRCMASSGYFWIDHAASWEKSHYYEDAGRNQWSICISAVTSVMR